MLVPDILTSPFLSHLKVSLLQEADPKLILAVRVRAEELVVPSDRKTIVDHHLRTTAATPTTTVSIKYQPCVECHVIFYLSVNVKQYSKLF